ncbi:MAG: hypothetical protein SFU55_11075 [Methylophilus sp.]|nr:hypothetical protein [Methylophilus sp.]
MFKFKKWLWTKYQALMGSDRAYAKYLAHFNHYQEHVVDKTLQQEANVKAMTKEEFLLVWNKPKKQCKPGCCR